MCRRRFRRFTRFCSLKYSESQLFIDFPPQNLYNVEMYEYAQKNKGEYYAKTCVK